MCECRCGVYGVGASQLQARRDGCGLGGCFEVEWVHEDTRHREQRGGGFLGESIVPGAPRDRGRHFHEAQGGWWIGTSDLTAAARKATASDRATSVRDAAATRIDASIVITFGLRRGCPASFGRPWPQRPHARRWHPSVLARTSRPTVDRRQRVPPPAPVTHRANARKGGRSRRERNGPPRRTSP